MKFRFILFAFLVASGWFVASAQQEARLLRFPAIYGNQIVFSYAGDLYSVSANGGLARKLTTHNGYEVFPKFSPDGKYIAFTGQYDGNTEVFLIPSQGGTPKRLTYTATLVRDDVGDRMGPNNIVMEWTPDGKNIIYRSRRHTFNDFTGQLFMVPVEGGMSKEIPLTNGGFCTYSPDGKKLAFNWVFREFRTWKYYVGGMADDIRIYDFATGNIEKITDNINQDIFPMWIGDEIFFLSDRDRTMNMFVYNTVSKKTEKVTSFDNYDIKFPSRSKDAIVFENGGFIYKFDPKTRKQEKLSISIMDDNGANRNVMKDASKNITSVSPSTDGERVAISARGDIFNVPVKEGITRNITSTSGVHERNAIWSPDGKYIAWVSDANGEFEIWLQKSDESEPPVQITKDENTYLFDMDWSPDSKKILYSTKKNDLRYVDVQSRKITITDKSQKGPFYDASWSPDSKWIAFVRPEQGFRIIRLLNLENSTVTDLTDNWYESDNPVFSQDGKYLFFVSERDFNPTFSQTEFNHAYLDMSRIYLIVLAKDTPSPFALTDDQVKLSENKSVVPALKDNNKKVTDASKPDSLGKNNKIDLPGIRERVVSLPVQPANYGNLISAGDKIFYNMNSQKGGASGTKYFDLKEKKEVEVGQGLSLTLVPSGKKMLVRQAGKYGIIPIPSGKVELKETINTDNMHVSVDLGEEWTNIFNESWRQMRDFFYDPGMHGNDWKKIHDKYAVMLPYVNHRNDLTYLIGEMVAELSSGHTYVNNGERPMPERIQTGLLGAELSKDPSGFFRIDRILDGANWNEELVSPLREIGVDVNNGDFIIAVNGTFVNKVNDIYELLVGQAGKLVELTVNSKPEVNGSHKVVVKPIASESALYYYNWVQNNTKKVSEATNGRVGYIHIPDMGVPGLNQFIEHYYPQLNKEALIIDDRGNGGGNVSPQIIERLMRTITYATMSTGYTIGDVNPGGTHLGPKVALCDKYSASDGDLFSYRFKYNKIGPLIGTRTWGGVIGIAGAIPCIDGGSIYTPAYAPYAADGSGFIIEGHGVDPDIVIENDPHKEYLGQDDQLNKAIEVALDLLKTQGKKVPPIPPFPDKSGKK
jgi:tricorn protease